LSCAQLGGVRAGSHRAGAGGAGPSALGLALPVTLAISGLLVLMLLFARIESYYHAVGTELDLGLIPHRPLPAILQNQRGLLLATVLRASTDVVICTIPYRLTSR
jgi:hypothetical protein